MLKKGTSIGPGEVEALTKAGVKEIVVVRLEAGDVSEDVAAASIAQAVAGEGVNVGAPSPAAPIFSRPRAGVLVVDRAAVDGINRVDEAITFATLAGLQARGRRRDDRDRQAHSLRGRSAVARRAVAAAGKTRSGSRPTASEGRHRLDPAARARAKGGRQDAAGDGDAAGAGRRDHFGERRVPHDEAVSRRHQGIAGLGAELVIVFGAPPLPTAAT